VPDSTRNVFQKLLDLVESVAKPKDGREAAQLDQRGPVVVDWSQRRAPPKPRDKVLRSETHLWIRSIPWPVQPKHLCRAHPHLANRLAQCWGSHAQVMKFMDDVLVDRRGHRKGVSDKVRLELTRLAELHAERSRPGGARRREAPTGTAATNYRVKRRQG
jgi:hypothetical protein